MAIEGFPAEFLRLLDAPINEAFEALDSVPPRPSHNRQWAEVARALRNLRATRAELGKLAEWLRALPSRELRDGDGRREKAKAGQTKSHRGKPFAATRRRT